MVKQGPCCHCGITTTPLWRNGPPEKPVLCNACGSRWRTKGTLANYTPMHSGGYVAKLQSTNKLSRGKMSQTSKEHHLYMRKEPYDVQTDSDFGSQQSDCFYFKGVDENTSTKSSIGSGLTYSEGSAQNMTVIGNFSVTRPFWDCRVPTKKRSHMSRSFVSKEKLARMHSFLYGHKPFMFTYSSEEDLLLDYKPPSMATEIGLGGVFIRTPLSMVQNSACDHTQATKSDLSMVHAPPLQNLKGTSRPIDVYDRAKEVPIEKEAEHEDTLVGNNCGENNCPHTSGYQKYFSHNFAALQSCLSLLMSSDLKDIVNLDTFTNLLTDQEQHDLLKYLSSADVPDTAESLKDMFKSSQFESALTTFQHLLSKGILDPSSSDINPLSLELYQQLLTMTDLNTSRWAERRVNMISHRKSEAVHRKEKRNGEKVSELNLSSGSANLASIKSQQGWNSNHFMPGAEETSSFGSSSWVIQSSPSSASPHSVLSEAWQPSIKRNKERCMSRYSKSKGSLKHRWSPTVKSCCFSSSDIGLSGQYGFLDAHTHAQPDEADLLLNVPSNLSYQQAELLQQTTWHKPQVVHETIIENDQDLKSADSYIVNSAWGLEESPDFGKLLRSNSLPRARARST